MARGGSYTCQIRLIGGGENARLYARPLGDRTTFRSQVGDTIDYYFFYGPRLDGAFTLYDDEGDNYDYEKGSFATIPIRWDEKSQTLEIGARRGTYPGMAATRTFNVVWVSEGHGVGDSTTKQPDVVVHYHGEPVTVAAKPVE